MKLEDVKKEYEEILKQLENPELISDFPKFEELSKRKKQLEKIVEKQKEIEEAEKQILENKDILKNQESDELSALAGTEIASLEEKEKILRQDLERLLKEEEDEKKGKLGGPHSVIMEIRAGTGGEEAALFAGDLFRMYSRYAELQGWKKKILDSHPTELGGYKEIIFELSNGDAYSDLKLEGGVHRVQRIPNTEKNGRVHTSTATVAVLAKPKSTEIKIKPEELRTDLFCSSGAGGQNVNRRETAVRITHLPTGISVASQTERSQLQNKENAMAILSAKIMEIKQREAEQKFSGNRNSQIGSAERAEKIRTYNFPQDRVTDHRIKKSWHGIEKIMEGEMEAIIKELKT